MFSNESNYTTKNNAIFSSALPNNLTFFYHLDKFTRIDNEA